MTALTQDRNTPSRSRSKRTLPVKAAAKIFAGAMSGIDATGFLVPMSTSATLKCVGRNERRVDNTAGANGAVNGEVSTGTFRFANSAAADLITLADIGADCYAVDDQTVAKTSATSTRSVAGKIFDVDASGVWVTFS
jgi:hypothetical protein